MRRFRFEFVPMKPDIVRPMRNEQSIKARKSTRSPRRAKQERRARLNFLPYFRHRLSSPWSPNLFPPLTTDPSWTERSSPVHIRLHIVCATTNIPLEETMKLKFALVGLLALGGAALTAGAASAMPLAPLGQPSNVESVALVCGPNGCIRTAPRAYGYGVRRGYGYGVRRGGYGYGYRRGYRRW